MWMKRAVDCGGEGKGEEGHEVISVGSWILDTQI
jgi:hypothetical protein